MAPQAGQKSGSTINNSSRLFSSMMRKLEINAGLSLVDGNGVLCYRAVVFLSFGACIDPTSQHCTKK
ncbi:hypothetical protein E2C01_045265 [Portunus trituberculatus]|uniref:Uncharacterized protein n=1 Tax=Portunus trituberculatus TaxID=210409 RepID=A0A5B7G1L9_PORTR|nr:hypothetical protein [Portunus trituberculatus]